jgi:hypothetical protein
LNVFFPLQKNSSEDSPIASLENLCLNWFVCLFFPFPL